MIHRDSGLLENILTFSHALRRRKVGVTVGNVLDAFRGVSFIDIEERNDFHYLLKSNFVSSREEMKVFDELFEQFWSFDDQTGPSIIKVVNEKMEALGEDEELLSFESKKKQSPMNDWADESEEKGSKEQEDIPAYSPDEILGQKDFAHFQREELEKVKEWVTFLSLKIAMRLSRRWKKGRKGDRLDFRRSIRESIKYGGEIIELRKKERKSKPLRLIVVCDVSGSMDIYSQFFLLFMHGLQNHYPLCQTFAFSTRLNHVTPFLKRRTFEQTLGLLSNKLLDWSGGTNIGGALHQLHQRHSDLFHSNRSLFLIFSDGWDRGDTMLLDSEMKSLKRQVKRLIWLNPLLGNQNYQPLCKGMSTALPYIDHFLPCHNLLSLKKLGRLISNSF